MKNLKLFPKTFLYTLILTLFIVTVVHALIYFLAPRMQLEISADSMDGVVLSVNHMKFITEAIRKALPISLICSLLISVICSLLFSKAIADPIKKISLSTEKMMKLNSAANCDIYTNDEIGILAQNVNKLYSDLLSTIESLEYEKNAVRDMEHSKVDFLRAASHELKTPVTALNAILENIILGVGKYRDYDMYLPKCKEISDNLSKMIHDILETSKINANNEKSESFNITDILKELCEPYKLIAAAHGIAFSVNLSCQFNVCLPINQFKKALSNIIANAVQYTEAGGSVSVYAEDRNIIIENECAVIPKKETEHLFEPFYRREFSRDKKTGGNGLGLYIVKTIFNAMNIKYSFEPIPDLSGMRFTVFL